MDAAFQLLAAGIALFLGLAGMGVLVYLVNKSYDQ